MMPARGCFGVFTKYLGPTNHRGGRVKATAQSGRSVTVAWDHALDVGPNHEAAARVLCGLLCLPHADGTDVAKGRCLRVSMGEGFVFVFPDAVVAMDPVPCSCCGAVYQPGSRSLHICARKGGAA